MAKVFISYRRDDSAPAAERIYERLVADFGKAAVFKDVDNIPLAVSFSQYIAGVIQQCAVQIVVIGRRWLDSPSASGGRRLDDPNDLVRLEIEAGLRRGIAVIPLLVGGAQMPNPAALPPSLRELCARNGLPVRDAPRDFDEDMTQVVAAVARWVKPAPAQTGQQARLLSTTLTYGIVLALLCIPGAGLEAYAQDSALAYPSSSDGSTELLFLALMLVPAVIVSLLASAAVARRTGRVWPGAWAGALASGLGGLLGGALYGWIRASQTLVSTASRPDAGSSALLGGLAGLALGLVIGLVLGALGATMGKRRGPKRIGASAVAR
jgi:hypothetical protein